MAIAESSCSRRPVRLGWAVVWIGVFTGLAAPAAAPSASGSAFERFDRHGIVFEYPRSWFVTARPLSNGLNPTYRFAVTNVRVRRTKRDIGPCLPGVARQLPPTAVLAYLREAVGADRARSLPGMRPRPRSFRLPTPSDNSLCGFGPRSQWIPFKAQGRVFYLGIHVGLRAPTTRIRVLQRLLDEMRIKPR